MFLLNFLLLVAQGDILTSEPLWVPSDVLIEDSLGTNVDFAADYNYSNGNIYVACIPDSGTYFEDNWGLLLFRSTDHGSSWEVLLQDIYSSNFSLGNEIDIVATRNDTVYVLLSWHDKSHGYDELNIAKIYDAGGIWDLEWLLPSAINATEILSPKLERDDFDDFYLYMTYLDIRATTDIAFILRSTDRGYNWDSLAAGYGEYQDEDMAVADSTLYCLWTYESGNRQVLQYGHWRNRGNATVFAADLFRNDTTIYAEIKNPRIGVTTTLPDSEQLVYTFYSQEELLSGDHNLLYLYSEKGGDDWPSTPGTLTPDTLVKGSLEEIYSDIRGYQVAPNQYMNIAYCFTTFDVPFPTYQNFWRWSSESGPTNWHDTTLAGAGETTSIPELVYSPGASSGGSGIVYNDGYGNLWFDAPWFSGITEDNGKRKNKMRSQVALAGSIVEVGFTGAAVYDVTGREIIKLNTESWDLRDRNGNEVKGGIYFIVNSESGERVKISLIK